MNRMVIGDMMTFYEDSVGDIRSGVSYSYLRDSLKDAGLDLSSLYYTKAIKAYHEKKPVKALIKEAREVLMKEIEEQKPDYILLFGAVALEVLTNKTNLTKNRGVMFDHNGIQCMATYAPGAVIRQPSNLWTFRADLNYFARTSTAVSTGVPKEFTWTLLETRDQVIDAIAFIEKAEVLSYDIETTALKDLSGKLLMLGICCKQGDVYNSFIFPMETSLFDMNTPGLRDLLHRLLSKDSKIVKVAQNAKFDNRWLRSRGIYPYVTFDTYLAAYTLNSELPHGLKYMAKAYCGASDYDAEIEFKEDLTLKEYKAMAEYCALDCYYTLKLYDVFKGELAKDPALTRVFKYIIMPGERVLQGIEDKGIYVDKERLTEVKADFASLLEKEKDCLNRYIPKEWETFNPGSPKQLGELLFDHLKLPVLEKTETGARATGRSVLARLVDKHPVVKHILTIRKYDKAINAFLSPWEEYLKVDGRLHTTYNIAKTSTGRLSAEDPNLQQVPRMKEVRGLIGAPPGKALIQADFSQIELRVAAFIANAESMKRVYSSKGDIHTLTAANVAKVRIEDVTKDMRTKAKAVNFGFLFGMWWKAFKEYAFDSYGVIVTDEEAKQAREVYFQTYPELGHWHVKQKNFAINNKHVRNPLGRVRYLYDIDSHDKDLKGKSERKAINTPVQSMASDMTLLSMIIIDQQLKAKYPTSFLVGQVHDAILIECDEKDSQEIGEKVKKVMEAVPVLLKKYFGIDFDVPVEADVEVGNWGMGEPLKKV